MPLRHPSWTVAAAALFLAGCDNQDTLPTPPPTPPAPPAVTDSYAVTSGGRLLSFNIAGSGAPQLRAALTGLAAGETVVDVAFRPRDGLLYGLVSGAGGAARIVTINTGTGATTAVSTLVADPTDASAPFTGLAGSRFGIGFNPVPDRLRVVSDSGENLRINVATGATTTDGALNGAAATGDGTAYTNAFNTACRTQQFTLDSASDTVYLQNPPNDGVLTAIGALGVDADAVVGVDVVTSATGVNALYALLTTTDSVSGEVSHGVYAIDSATGAATLTGEVGVDAGDAVVGYASRTQDRAVAQAAGELFGLTADGDYATFNRAAPGKLCTGGAVSGLPADVSLLGIDTRPATGQIVGVGSDNTLYAVTNAGVATELCDLAADPADVTAPFATLPTEATFGVGFNPVPDRLRVIASSGENLRINPTPNGAGQCLVTTDTPISGATSVTTAAYTNAIAGTASTALYGVDSGTDSLVRIGNDPANGIANDPGNPNSGVATTIGSLGLGDVAGSDAMLIDGRSNGVLLATAATDATASTLYTVNLGTGAATAVGTIGGGSGTTALAPVVGMALTTGSSLRVHALTADNHLLTFTQVANVLQPNAATDLTLTGLTSGEDLVGIDTRPANGLLYALSTLGRVYVVNTTTGLATLASMLPVPPAAGATFGTDFNPVPDRLRAVDTAGNNLRINVSSGATLTDGAINGAATSGVIASAYTNSFAGTATTTLYNLDATQLFTQVPPNMGTLVLVGSTSVTASGDAGFDIAGGANGLVLAAISTGAGPSDLYRINLATGAATVVGVAGDTARIGSAGSAQVRSLAIDLR
jgi:hypothetical protein